MQCDRSAGAKWRAARRRRFEISNGDGGDEALREMWCGVWRGARQKCSVGEERQPGGITRAKIPFLAANSGQI